MVLYVKAGTSVCLYRISSEIIIYMVHIWGVYFFLLAGLETEAETTHKHKTLCYRNPVASHHVKPISINNYMSAIPVQRRRDRKSGT